MSENNQKIKLLKILEYLRTESAKEHPATTSQIIAYLKRVGTTCDRRTLYKDMNMLIENGVDVIKTESGRENAYYIEEKALSLGELKILIDAIQTANFITTAKTNELTKTLLSMAGVRKREIVRNNIVFYNTHKHSNEEIFKNTEQIELAIQQKRQISFYYFDLDEHCCRVYRKNKARYLVSPIALICNEDKYYLIAYSYEHCEKRNYRTDRMEAVEIEDSPICEEAKIHKRSLSAYTEQIFRMYQGKTEEVTLEFTKNLIGVVYDKFGEDTVIKCADGGRFKIKVPVQISPPFWGWLFQFKGEMKIIAPDSAIQEYCQMLETTLCEERDYVRNKKN